MFITEKIVEAFNRHMTQEHSNYLQYSAIANYFAAEDLRLLEGFYRKQAEDERTHALKFTEFIIDSGARAEIQAIPAQKNAFTNAADAAQTAYDAEVRTTEQINELMNLAIAEKSYSAQQFLHWFIQEQVEEIATAQANLSIIKRAGNNLMMVEGYLAHGKG